MLKNAFLLHGGLGNQLFILSAASHYAEMNGDNSCVNLVVSELGKAATPRTLELDNFEFNIDVRYFEINQFALLKIKVLRKLQGLFNINLAQYFRIYLSKGNGYEHESAKEIVRSRLTSGYFQSWLYPYSGKTHQVMSSLQLKHFSDQFAILRDQALILKPIVVHIRRGDYLKHTDEFGLLDFSYFVAALKNIERWHSRPVWVFSDDSIKNELSQYLNNASYISDLYKLSAPETLVLMSHGSDIVISNSTFSWWAAFLMQSRDPQSVVVAPNPWSKNWVGQLDLIPDNWTKTSSIWVE